jgi:hypothetical protein
VERPGRGPGWLLPGQSAAQELHEHQGLVNVAHAHALGDVVPQALVGGGGGWGHGGILAGIPCAGRLAGAEGVTGGGTGGGEALPRCHALLQALSQALRDASSPFPCVGCTNITVLLK